MCADGSGGAVCADNSGAVHSTPTRISGNDLIISKCPTPRAEARDKILFMNTIQILYSTAEGQARLIAERMAAQLEAAGFNIQCENVTSAVMRVRPAAVLLVASIHVGKHAPAARDFVKRNL